MKAVWWGVTIVVVLAEIPGSVAGGQSQAPTFRSGTSVVTVPVTVKRSNAIVAGLTAADFRLTDNGVPQTVDAIAVELVPIDVTLFLDTSGSTAGALDDMQRDVQSIVTMLRPGDRFRLLTIADAVEQPVPWVEAGTRLTARFSPVGGISLVHDALMFGLLHRVDPGRRHLLVGMTDRQDCGSVVSSAQLLDAAARVEAVIHLVDYSGGSGEARYRVRSCTPRGGPNGAETIRLAAERTGGELHVRSRRILRSWSASRAFQTIFDEFRQSYVLQYAPAGVDTPGWHPIVVQVPNLSSATVRARHGYYRD